MAIGHVKVFHTDRSFGRITGEDGGEIIFSADAVTDGPANSGDEVEFDITEAENARDRRAIGVTITKKAPESNPVGRVMMSPPSWDALEELDRAKRAARRRRR